VTGSRPGGEWWVERGGKYKVLRDDVIVAVFIKAVEKGQDLSNLIKLYSYICAVYTVIKLFPKKLSFYYFSECYI
jgi:hypothetical protein